jgi:hypothetical protein
MPGATRRGCDFGDCVRNRRPRVLIFGSVRIHGPHCQSPLAPGLESPGRTLCRVPTRLDGDFERRGTHVGRDGKPALLALRENGPREQDPVPDRDGNAGGRTCFDEVTDYRRSLSSRPRRLIASAHACSSSASVARRRRPGRQSSGVRRSRSARPTALTSSPYLWETSRSCCSTRSRCSSSESTRPSFIGVRESIVGVGMSPGVERIRPVRPCMSAMRQSSL